MTDDYLRAFSGAVKHDSPNHYPSLKYRSGHHKPKGVATMTKAKKNNELFLFFRKGMFYPVEIPRDEVLINVELNPGTLKVEDIEGNIVWRPQ